VRDVQRENVQQPDSRLTKTRQSTGHTCPWRRNPKDSSGFDLAAARRSCGKGAKENRAGGVLSPLRRIPTGGESVGASQRSPCSRTRGKKNRAGLRATAAGATRRSAGRKCTTTPCANAKKNNRESRDEHESDPKTKGKNAIDNLVQKLSGHTLRETPIRRTLQLEKNEFLRSKMQIREEERRHHPRCKNQNFQLTSTWFTTDSRRSPFSLPHLIKNQHELFAHF
jgi:hypothetical protein